MRCNGREQPRHRVTSHLKRAITTLVFHRQLNVYIEPYRLTVRQENHLFPFLIEIVEDRYKFPMK